ncbi:response regulator [Parenemella sanctibonifatiensis]|uniref:DNA-binding response regulator n=1 Tax=Parenemella sanctibonifatiensis TaxID=2016505 RepID=A0A255EQX9_9ACTN|nr:response regulator transcription factor [Parenemella sanctibonifatiensis]OYN92005.1 DNA-binding response regulator [Parenemella sanctibonifatiensis]
MTGAATTRTPDQVRVVLVDDHPVVRDGLAGMLGREDRLVIVGEAADGVEALAVIRSRHPDVVLMDLRMPGGDGIEAIRHLRAGGSAVKVLVLTTYDTDRDVREALAAGADGYLLKDTPRADLVRAVLDVAAGRSVLTAAALRSLTTPQSDQSELTNREREVLAAVAAGGTNRQVAKRLLVSETTIKTHLVRIYGKLGVSDRAAAVRAAYERGLL